MRACLAWRLGIGIFVCGVACAGAQRMPPGRTIEPMFPAPAASASAVDPGGALQVRLAAPAGEKRSGVPTRRAIIGEGRWLAREGLAAPQASSLEWRTLADGSRSATVLVQSAGARQLRVGIDLRAAPAGLRIRVAPASNPAAAAVMHEEQVRNGVAAGTSWTPITEGDAQVVEFSLGPGDSLPALDFGVVAVSHIHLGMERLQKDVGDSLSCQVDVACVSSAPNLEPAVRTAFNTIVDSTALIVMTDGTGATGTCTGTLINNDYRLAVLLTAEHCIPNANEANNLVTVWGFQATTCAGPVGNWISRGGGAVLLAVRADLDQSLLALRQAPPASAVLSAWDVGSVATGELMLGMHHPRGDLKKTSIGTITGISGAFSLGSTQYPANRFFLTSWQVGLVESGSSGSGLYIQPPGASHLALVGVLNSGPATDLACAAASGYTNRYGMFRHFHPDARRFLDKSFSANRTGLWWNAAESGWGVNVQHQGETIFATWFTYDLDGRGMWLVMSNGARTGTNEYQGELFRTRGTPLHQINGAPAIDLPLEQVGSARFTFTGTHSATFSYTVNGVSGSKSIQRQVFSPQQPTCEFSMNDRSGADNFQDLYWNAAENGWGINITHQGDTVFATWFTYDADRSGMWLVMSNGERIAPRTYRGALFRTTGRPFSQINGTPALNQLIPVGTLTLTFTDGLNATMAYTVDGIPGTKAITRQVFALPFTACRQ